MAGSHMTMETAARAIDYMQEQADGTPIKIVWFGGEPLFNYPVIDFISGGLREKGLQFESEMITNGLLFDSALTEKAKTLWNVKTVQVTLDGTMPVYNRIKAYVTDIENPFERVLKNIKSLLREKIEVGIRINVGLHNYEDIRELADFLCEEFRGEKYLYIYASPLIELREYTDEQKTSVYEILDELKGKLKPIFGKKSKKEFSDKITNSYCMATGREAVTILPDGRVGICENITSGVLLGNIFSKELDVKAREDFGRRFYREDKCRPCPMYPNCYIVKGCPNKDDKEGCETVKRDRQINRIKEKMKMRFRLGASGDDEEASSQK
jgi:radical SAM protein with 4Fe4S-binding SPASM domain